MSTKHRTAAEQKFWDEAFFEELRKQDGKRSEESRINASMVLANVALDARRRSQKEHQ